MGSCGKATAPSTTSDGIGLAVDVLGEDGLELVDELLQVLGGQIGVGGDAAVVLHGDDGVLEQIAVEAHHDVGEHLDEAAVGVPSEARVVGLLDEAVDGLVVKAEVQHGVHHAGHGEGGAGANGHEQRILGVTEALAHALLQVGAVLGDGVERAFRPNVAGVGVLHAGLARDGESGRHRQPDVGHLGEVRALAAEHPLHLGVALGSHCSRWRPCRRRRRASLLLSPYFSLKLKRRTLCAPRLPFPRFCARPAGPLAAAPFGYDEREERRAREWARLPFPPCQPSRTRRPAPFRAWPQAHRGHPEHRGHPRTSRASRASWIPRRRGHPRNRGLPVA